MQLFKMVPFSRTIMEEKQLSMNLTVVLKAQLAASFPIMQKI